MNVETTILRTFSLPTSKALTPTHYLTHVLDWHGFSHTHPLRFTPYSCIS